MSSGKYIDIRERSTVLHEEELTIEHLPKGKIVKNNSGVTKGTPLKIGDTVIYKDYLGEELGLSIANVVRGDKAYQLFKDKYKVVLDPLEGMEYVLVEVKFESYDSKEEPHPVFNDSFELWTDDIDPKKYELVHFYSNEDTKGELKTGESTIDGVVFLVPKDENLYAVYTYDPEDPLWFEIE
ncbi:hypothetical protein J14TS2_34690 [Bacillus sp. J14TS2]|uniref:hypothetical protein n=1 Tax=Bacillus sp. J14TS2 TaxID=2807188 RepID=UPI001B2EDAB2|nr:hypothetical protein [Bacillus sp. J14TS2]GIN72994.1 hypothetical protein J14TS2_34690 [Bacillus sp. J14TS2]